MLKILIPVVLILFGAGAGIGAGLMLKPSPAAEVAMDETHPCGDGASDVTKSDEDKAKDKAESSGMSSVKPGDEPDDVSFEYARLKNQFVVPIIRDEIVESIVVISISLEVQSGSSDDVFTKEPRLRDSFLQAMFDHAAIGGFDGAFVNNQNLKRLRNSLKERAYATLGTRVNDVLITHIARQDT